MLRTISLIFLLIICVFSQSIGWYNVKFDWTNPASWTWINYGTSLSLPARVTSTPGQLLLYYDPNNVYSNPGEDQKNISF
jgi:hypothetical protein